MECPPSSGGNFLLAGPLNCFPSVPAAGLLQEAKTGSPQGLHLLSCLHALECPAAQACCWQVRLQYQALLQ
jgi:hypothetical protein